MLPLQLFRSRRLSIACVLTLLLYSGLYGMMVFLSLNLIQLQHYGEVSAGLAQLPILLLMIVLSAWVGRVVDRRGPRRHVNRRARCGGGRLSGLGGSRRHRRTSGLLALLSPTPDSAWCGHGNHGGAVDHHDYGFRIAGSGRIGSRSKLHALAPVECLGSCRIGARLRVVVFSHSLSLQTAALPLIECPEIAIG